MTTQPTVKYVVCKSGNYGRWTAQRGLNFETEQAGNDWIVANIREGYRRYYRVESRAVQADDSSERMTCQVCGRKYLARMGSVTHHGYTRPGGGYQTASCAGAKHAPFEKDHAVLDRVIVALAKETKDLREHAAETKADKASVLVSITNYDVEATNRFKRPTLTVTVTKDTFAQKVAQYPKSFNAYGGKAYGYEHYRDKQVAALLRNAKDCEDFREECVKRRATWKHTHNYSKSAKEWVPV